MAITTWYANLDPKNAKHLPKRQVMYYELLPAPAPGTRGKGKNVFLKYSKFILKSSYIAKIP